MALNNMKDPAKKSMHPFKRTGPKLYTVAARASTGTPIEYVARVRRIVHVMRSHDVVDFLTSVVMLSV